MNEKRLEELVLRHFDGDLSPDELRELELEMQQNPEAARLVRELADEQVFLTEALGRPIPSFVPPERKPSWAWAVAAFLVLALSLWALWPAQREVLEFDGTELHRVGRDVQFRKADKFHRGSRYLLGPGALQLGRTRLEIVAPSILTVSEVPPPGKRETVTIEGGHVRAAIPPDASGLELETVQGSVRNLGTTFELQLNEPMEEEAMIAALRKKTLPFFVSVLVSSGQVAWLPAQGEERVITPEMGRVNLSEDNSVGRVVDREGMVFVRPVLGRRWSLAGENTRLEVGAWLKTSARGANAAEIRLRDGSRLTLGPGGLVELLKGGRLRLYGGELGVKPIAERPVRVEGPGDEVTTLNKAGVLRARDGQLALLDEEPRWLTGFKRKSSTEALGSLLADIDGRNEPLSVGYHKVQVDIRDQIARTEIEESFVNHTDAVLEGVFYFPLPQDASISGFAMWIGGELVEADIVEKQRAREIYETILREKRDPGLLEWTGGNIFKARVYPIPANGEKRIRITYTQVLPKESGTYRYTYALESEMLRLHPLRELLVTVTISSAEPLASVASTSHMVRVRKTEHSAQVEFSAEEYVPQRDFELVVKTEPSKQPALVIPHLRGEAGYFMALLAMDQAGENATAETEPLEIILAADTSGSMTDAQIKEQRLFVATLLESLGDKDRFNLLAFDVTAEWAFERPVPATAENRDQALDLLERRGALGWTDLDLAFQELFARALEKTHIIYVGDGMATRGDADPAAFASRLKRGYPGRGTVHAVAVGSAFELITLRAMASLGSGSLHSIGGGKDAAEVAADLLREIATPGLENLQFEFQGIQVARVYPEDLPNLPAGRQQIILGRYLPEKDELKGTLRLSATAAGKELSWEIPLDFSSAAQGNSFIPRFWARLHLDHLLAQGSTPEVVQKIVTLSEDYQIITPYTSFLVLESDADRERFRVKKRLRMRDGAEFFAKGREDANYELLRQQTLAARRWRLGIRSRILELYGKLGLDLVASPTPRSRDLSRHSSLYAVESRAWADADGEGSDGVQGLSLGTSANGVSFADDALMLSTSDFDGDGALDLFLGDSAGTISPNFSTALSEEMVYFGTFESAGLQRGRGTRGESRGVLGRMPRRSRPPQPPFASIFHTPGGVRKPLEKHEWPQTVREAIGDLDRRRRIAKLETGLQMAVESDNFNHRGKSRPLARATYLLSAGSWARTAHAYGGRIPELRWCDREWRGMVDLGRLLGSRRKAKEGDTSSYPPPLEVLFEDLERTYAAYRPSLTREGDRATLRLVHRRDKHNVIVITVDLKRQVLETITYLERGEKRSEQVFSGFTEVAGAFWPTVVEWKDRDGKLTRRTKITYEALTKEAFQKAFREATKVLPRAILLDLPAPKLTASKQNALAGKATFHDRWVLMNHFAATQRWKEVKEHHAQAEALAPGKAGLDWIRLAVLKASRRNEEARALVLELAGALAKAAAEGDFGLARDLQSQARGIFQQIEQLELNDTLRPVYERQDDRLEPLRTWGEERLGRLRSLGRNEEVFRLRKSLAEDYPHNVDRQINYADALVGRGELDLAIAHLEKHGEQHGPWTEAEAYRLRWQAAAYLYNHRRLQDYLKYVDRWLAGEPGKVEAEVFNHYLSALVMLDRADDADALIAEWLQIGNAEDLEPLREARLHAAVSHGLGQGTSLGVDWIEPRWRPALIEVARTFSLDERRHSITDRVLEYWRFRQTGEAAAMRRELYGVLAENVNTLSPSILSRLFHWTRNASLNEEDVPRETLIRHVFSRWEKEEDEGDKSILESILVSRGGSEIVLELRRKQLELAEGEQKKAQAAWNLFQKLCSRPWSAELESELFGLISQVGSGEHKIATQASAVRRLAKFLPDARARVLIEAIPDRNKKSRRELQPLEEEGRKKARAEVLVVFRRFETSGVAAELVPFVRIERLTLEVPLEEDAPRLAKELTELFNAIPEPPGEENEEASADPLAPGRGVLAGRALRLLARLATAAEADPALAEDLGKTLDAAVARKTKLVDAKEHKYQLLVALDRAEEIKATLKRWFEEAGEIAGNRWRIPYGYILAETNDVPAAIEVFESVEKTDELGPAEYTALANWYLVKDLKEKRREARVQAYQVTNEWQIRNSLRHELRRYRRQGDHIPEELDEEVLLRFAAVLRKSSAPRRHIDVLREYYEATKDFRLLETLSEALIGQSAAKVYDALSGLNSVLRLIGDEATIDRLEKYLSARFEEAAGGVDRRALRLLEFLVERQAAAQAHGTKGHTAAALRALKEAFKGEWSAGERVLMARFLAQAGALVEPLRSEQLRQLKLLHDAAETGSYNRFRIACYRSDTLWSNADPANDRILRERSIQVLEATLVEHRKAHAGLIPQNDAGRLSSLGSRLEAVGEYATAERLWRGELAREYNRERKRWFVLQLYSFYARALEQSAETALGSGAELYRAVEKEILADLGRRSDESHARELVRRLCDVYSKAHEKSIGRVQGDLRDFAFQGLPGILGRYQHRGGQSTVAHVAECMRTVLGPLEALSFLVTRAETEPNWLKRLNGDFWRHQGGRVAEYRSEAKRLGPLEPRLLSIVLTEIRRDLGRRSVRNRSIYDCDHKLFWKKQAEAFFEAAGDVLADHRDNEGVVRHIASYLYDNLDRYGAAIEALSAFHRLKGLSRSGQWQLVEYLQKQKRHGESIPLLVKMVEKWPGDIAYRTRLMRAYSHAKQPGKLRATLKAADAYFHEEKRWRERTIAQLGSICLETGLHEEAVVYYEEAVPMRRKRSRNRGVGDETLALYYSNLARALGHLGRTKDAVDAAAGAIVVWSTHRKKRAEAKEALQEILRKTEDLEGYARTLEAKLAKSDMENPTVRHALGLAFLERKDFPLAVKQLEAAVASKPEDTEIQNDLIRAYDASGDSQAAASRLLALARMRGHQFDLYKELGERWQKSGDRAQGERAYTTIAELSANESEGRALLAKIREEQKRFSDAAVEWQQVIRIRTKDPSGYLGLARALIGMGQREEARQRLDTLLKQPWPAWFGDVHEEARKLLKQAR